MFDECTALREIKMYRFNFDKIKDKEELFDGCLSLKSIRISQINESGFNKSKIKKNLPKSIQIFCDGFRDY